VADPRQFRGDGTRIAHRHGLLQLSTVVSLFSQLILIWAVLSLPLLFIAWWSAARGNTATHRGLMIFLTLAAWVFIISYLMQYRSPGEITPVPPEYVPWVAIHGTVGLLPLIGASILVWARLFQRRHPDSRLHLNRRHRIYGRVVIALWAFTHLGGIVNYWLFA